MNEIRLVGLKSLVFPYLIYINERIYMSTNNFLLLPSSSNTAGAVLSRHVRIQGKNECGGASVCLGGAGAFKKR